MTPGMGALWLVSERLAPPGMSCSVFIMQPIHLYSRVLELVDLLGRDMSTYLRDQGLSTARAHALWVLHQGGAMPQHALASRLDVTPRNVTGLIDGLASMGLVSRDVNPSDRRINLVSLTQQGTEMLSRMESERDRVANALFCDWSEEQQELFSELLGRCVEDLRGMMQYEE
jgi:DNA-binding MarR family transcriptional regulator